MGSRSFFDQADDVVAPGGNFGEPEMSGGVGSGRAEIGNQPLFRLEPGQCIVQAVGQRAWRCSSLSVEAGVSVAEQDVVLTL